MSIITKTVVDTKKEYSTTETGERIYSVIDINKHIAKLMKGDNLLSSFTIEGEISQFKVWNSGHIYFTIKDEFSKLDGMMYASSVPRGLTFKPSIGDKVRVTGYIEAYEKDGNYKLYARKISKAGSGELYARYLEIKQRLEEMGMFDDQYKQPLPKYAKTIGVVTSKNGAVIHDIIRTSREHFPGVQIILYPSGVQGDSAIPEIVAGIKALDAYGVDVIIVGRGGGEVDQLWCYNSEEIARAVFECSTPIVSAVGHETDFYMCDLAADDTVATPTMAAQHATLEYAEFLNDLQFYKDSFDDEISAQILQKKDKLENYRNIFERYSPVNKLNTSREKLSNYENLFNKNIQSKIVDKRNVLDGQKARLLRLIEQKLAVKRNELAGYSAAVEASSPLKRISAGFAYVSTEKGRVTSAAMVEENDKISTYFADGIIESVVTTVKEVEKPWEK